MSSRRGFGKLQRMRSGRFQASYVHEGERHYAATTYGTRGPAESWLEDERRLIEYDQWTPPAARHLGEGITFREYADDWLPRRETRRGPLTPKTRDLYRQQLDQHILPVLGPVPLAKITPAVIRRWYADLDKSRPHMRAKVYALVKTILKTAIDEDLMDGPNPARIPNAGVSAKPDGSRHSYATQEQLDRLMRELPERYRAMVLLGAWGALRWGELTELRRMDLILRPDTNGDYWLNVSRAVVKVKSEFIVGALKSKGHDASRRVALPAFIIPILREHLDKFSAPGDGGLIFPRATDPTRHLEHGSYYETWNRARIRAGMPRFRIHDLRHTGGTMATEAGGDLVTVMDRLGHSTVSAAMIYQHATDPRRAQLGRGLDELAARRRRAEQ